MEFSCLLAREMVPTVCSCMMGLPLPCKMVIVKVPLISLVKTPMLCIVAAVSLVQFQAYDLTGAFSSRRMDEAMMQIHGIHSLQYSSLEIS